MKWLNLALAAVFGALLAYPVGVTHGKAIARFAASEARSENINTSEGIEDDVEAIGGVGPRDALCGLFSGRCPD